jgi:hypothetical protein
VQLRLGRFNRRSAAWRLAGGSSPQRANFLQSVSRAMVGLDLEVVQKITWRFESYASIRCHSLCDRCGVDTTQGGAWLRLRLRRARRDNVGRGFLAVCHC